MEEKQVPAETPAISETELPEEPTGQPVKPRRKSWFKRHKKLTVLFLVIVAVAVVVVWRVRKAAVAASASASYQFVRTTTLHTGSLNDSVTVDGTVKSGEEATVTVDDAAKTYKVATVDVQVGDVVQEGDVIATLDTTTLEEQIQTAQQDYNDNLQAAQTSYDRAVDDYNTSVVQHENNLIDLQAKIDDADQKLSDAQDAVTNAKNSRDAAQSSYDAANASYNTIRQAYDTAQSSISSFTDAFNAAADAQNAALTALNDANAAYSADPSDANKAAVDAAQTALQTAQQGYNDAQKALEDAKNSCSVSEMGLYGFAAIEQALSNAEQTRNSAESALTQANNAVDTAETQVETCEQSVKAAHDSYDQEKNYSTIKTKAQSVEDAKTKLEDAKKTPDNLKTLQETLEKCTLTATMSGTVTALNATVGSVCTGTVATIQNTDALVVEITLAADDVPSLSTGMSCNITSDATGDTVIAGTLTQIDPVANDQGTFGGKVRVTGEADDLLIGIQARVEIVKNATDGVFTVPIDAVGTAEDGSSYVLRKTGGEGTDMTFEEVPVTTGESNDYYIIISGDSLAEGDVIRSSADLSEGIETADSSDSFPMGDMTMVPGGDMQGGRTEMGGNRDMGGGAGAAGDAPAGGPGGM